MLTILQIPYFCFSVFNVGFCDLSFRYFLMCVVFPSLIWLVVWWGPEISRMFCKKCQCVDPEPKSIKDVLREIVSKQDIERLITAAVVMGVQKFAASHPKTKETFDNILNTIEQSNNKTKQH